MKKLFTMLLCALSFCACNKDDEAIDYAALLVGQWVYDHPEEGVWETIKFTSSGMFYFSNTNEILYEFENENVNGRYFVEGDLVTGTYTLNGVSQMNLDMQITKINALEFTAKFNDSGLSFTYARLLATKVVNYQETIIPNYGSLLRGVDVIAYASHNTKVAMVNSSTGEVTGVTSGRTYIDVITAEGTAVVEIIVNGLLPYNFDEFIGENKSVIHETFGATPASEEDDVMVYQNISNEIASLHVGINLLTGKVSDIKVCLISAVGSSYVQNITEYLGKLYTILEGESTETVKAYINDENFDDASVAITWDMPNKKITYVAIDHDLFTDYSPLLGKSRNEVKAIMKDRQPFMEDESKLAYGISDGKVDMFCCFYTLDFEEYYEAAQVVSVRLSNQLNQSEVAAYLSNKYFYLEDESTSTLKVYLTHDGLVAIFYDTETKWVDYYSNISKAISIHTIRQLNGHFAKLK